MSHSTGYQLWGHRIGPVTDAASVSIGTTPTQLFDSSVPARTPHKHTKTIVVSNPSTAAQNVYVGNANVTTSAFMVELKPGDPPLVWDLDTDALPSVYAVAGAATSISVQQVG